MTAATALPVDILPIESCPWCDVELTPTSLRAGRCAGCGFDVDEETVWIFARHLAGPNMRATVLGVRTVLTIPAVVVVWITLGPVAGATVGGIFLAVTVFHIIRELMRRRTDGRIPLLLGPGGVSRWSDIARRDEQPRVIPWEAFDDVQAQELHDGSWRLTLRRALWQPDLGGLVRAEREEMKTLVISIRRRMEARSPRT